MLPAHTVDVSDRSEHNRNELLESFRPYPHLWIRRLWFFSFVRRDDKLAR